ncbi:MAG: hypothetical protein ACKVX9_24605 [Blastocatellia bacterium]
MASPLEDRNHDVCHSVPGIAGVSRLAGFSRLAGVSCLAGFSCIAYVRARSGTCRGLGAISP